MKKNSKNGRGAFKYSFWLKRLLIMKTIVIFMCLFGLMSSFAETDAQNSRLDFQIEKGTVKDVLEVIENQTGLSFMYDNQILDVNRIVTLKANNQSVEEVLQSLLLEENLKYERVNRYIIISANNPNAGQQVENITGTVIDKQGAPLPGVTVIIKGTTNGTVTNVDGKYVISDVPENATLVFSFVGMKPQEILVGSQSIIDVTLADETIGLDEVIAIGYGTQKKRDVTGSVQSISSKELENIPVAQIAQKLQGKTAGVEILQTTGIPGQGMSIRVRGAASINASSNPLYVVDGFPIVGDISVINPDEIESISILKDASATSLYGSRAANGVVLIKTKQGSLGKTQISFNAYYGVQTVPQKGRPDLMNAREFAQFQKEIREEKAEYTGSTPNIPEEYQNPSQYGKGTDWYNVLLRNAPIQSYNLTVTANKDKLRTSVVGGYLQQDGVLINSSFSRFSLRINTEYDINERIKLAVNVAPSHSISATPNSDGSLWGGGILEAAILTSPLAEAENEDGSLPLLANGTGLFPNPNWYRVAQEIKKRYQRNTFIGKCLFGC